MSINYEILQVANSFLVIKGQKQCLWIDPCVNPSNNGAWAPLVKNNNYKILDHLFLNYIPTHLFISHLHSDHFDPKFLEYIKDNFKNTLFYIKKFKIPSLRKKLISCVGKESIIELEAFKEENIGEMSFLVIPQYNNTSDSKESNLEFDMDTSILIKTEYGNIYSEIDNPLKSEDYKKIKSKLPKDFKNNLKLGFFGFSSATDYPQSYLNVDRKNEKDNLIKNSINRFFSNSKEFGSMFIVPAGGEYLLNGELSYLNDYIAVPSFKDLKHHPLCDPSKVLNPQINYFKLNESGLIVEKRFDNLPRVPVVDKDFRSNELINTQDLSIEEIRSLLNNLLLDIESNLSISMKESLQRLKTKIIINVTKDQPIYDHVRKGNQEIFFKHFINKKISSDIELNYYCSASVALTWLSGEANFDELFFYFLVKRIPNIYEPDVPRLLAKYFKRK